MVTKVTGSPRSPGDLSRRPELVDVARRELAGGRELALIPVRIFLDLVLAAIRNIVGRVHAASAALIALDYDVDVATRSPGLCAQPASKRSAGASSRTPFTPSLV